VEKGEGGRRETGMPYRRRGKVRIGDGESRPKGAGKPRGGESGRMGRCAYNAPKRGVMSRAP